MIVVKLMGGLGNQMFQYAAGRALANAHQTDLYLYLGWFGSAEARGDTPRSYELGTFKLSAKAAGYRIRLAVSRAEFGNTQRPALYKLFGVPELNLLSHRESYVDTNFINAPNNTLLEGWWQSYKYFETAQELIKRDFDLDQVKSQELEPTISKINHVDSVSFHVRRGDYVTNKTVSKHHGVAGLDYYQKAIETVARKVKNPEFFVVSDDMDWCRRNIKSNHPIYFLEPSKAPAKDIYLMSLCKHNIIANSSFSWWAAWLNKNPNKLVIAPKAWFLDKKAGQEVDNIPDSWIQL